MRLFPTPKFLLPLQVSAAILLLGCSEGSHGVDEEKAAINRIRTVFGGVNVAVAEHQAGHSRSELETAFPQIIRQPAPLVEALTKRTGPATVPVILSTNLAAWSQPSSHGLETAVMLADPIRQSNKLFFVGIRFDGQIVYFAGLTPQ